MTPQITVNEVYKAMNEKADIVLLDVRTPGEYNKGKIEGSINIPVDNISSNVMTSLPDKNKIVYVYCLSGSRSNIVVETMVQLGYTNVFSMTSGLLMWRSKKYPTVA
jgi:rhodanese-related sulfurtransferase